LIDMGHDRPFLGTARLLGVCCALDSAPKLRPIPKQLEKVPRLHGYRAGFQARHGACGDKGKGQMLSRFDTGMRMITAAGDGISGATGVTPAGEPQASAEGQTESRALVAIAPAAPREPLVTPRQAAPFLAHLIATQSKHPQTRLRRRAEPSEAVAAYRAVASLHPSP
jgi:hypothetical protein